VSENVPLAGGAADIARAALRHLATHRISPTPDNYAAAWEAVGGSTDPRTVPMPHAVAAEAAEAIRNANRRTRLMASMTELLEAVCTVVPTLVEDEQWVVTQFDAVRKAVRPAQGLPDRGELAHARQLLLATAAEHQKLLALRRESLSGVKDLLRQWLGGMGQLSEHSREYGAVLGSFVKRVESVATLEELATTLASTIEETNALTGCLDSTRTGLEASYNRAEELESRVEDLSRQLNATSAQLVTDHLTELLNRRGLEEAFHETWTACVAQRKPLALVLLDIDDFKHVNDSFGHQAGDDTLREFAVMLRNGLRPDDRSSRFGGEEFVLLLPGAPVDGALEMVRRLQRKLGEQALMGASNRPQFTFSGGVAMVVDGNFARALEMADDALYEAKRTGKNRVCARES
jgi:diguanylate cyclase